MKEVFKELIVDFHSMELPQLPAERLVELPELPNHVQKALVLIGMRRSGKTWVMYQMMQQLMAQGIEKSQILYINFEDDRLDGIEVKDLQLLLDAYYELYPEHSDNQNSHFFLDEIQAVLKWEKFIGRLIESGKMKLTLSGSSAKLLSLEIATSLRGRTIDREIFPLSFAEYCNYKGILLIAPIPASKRAVIQHHYNNYFVRGGFPETLEAQSLLQKELIQGYVESVLYRDIIERYGITNVLALKRLLSHCLKNAATQLSINKVYNSFKSLNIPVSRSTLYEYMGYLEDAYCIFSLEMYHYSVNKSSNQPKKIYPVDPGLISAYTIKPECEKGALLETAVFIQLRHKYKEIFYYHTPSGKEIDFVVVSPNEPPKLYQVCVSLKDEFTKKRELDALLEAMVALKLDSGYIITLDETETIDTPSGKIECMPAWMLSVKESD